MFFYQKGDSNKNSQGKLKLLLRTYRFSSLQIYPDDHLSDEERKSAEKLKR